MSSPQRLTVQELFDAVLDHDSFRSWDEPIDISAHSEEYRATLRRAAARAGTDESVVTGSARVHGRPVAVIANEFAFLAGSIGRAAADRITRAVERATAEGLPLVASTSSGGTRMQEGTPAFVHMARISRALVAHQESGLPYLVHLRHPTTGGVLASWGSLGHITVAEPDALVAFLGPKVYEALEGRPFPPGIQVSENLVRRGVIDAVVPTEELSEVLDRTLGLLLDPPTASTRHERSAPPVRSRSSWESIEITRTEQRPGVRDLLRHGSDAIVRLNGTDEGENDTAMMIAIARIDGVSCVLVGQDRTRQSPSSPMGPAALREARRGMQLANQLGLPLVSVIDTPGAELSPRAEEGAIAGEIARCIAGMTSLTVPSVSVLLGQGCGGGALALLPADRTIAAENAWLSPLPPEGASVIMHGDVGHAPEMVEQQQVSAFELRAAGTVSHLVAEPDGDTPEAFAHAVSASIGARLRELMPGWAAPRATRRCGCHDRCA